MLENRGRRLPKATDRARILRKGDNLTEGRLWSMLKDRQLNGYKFVRQFPVGPYFVDFLCRRKRLVVEVDGSQHFGSAHDRRRDDYMRRQGYSVLRFWNVDVLQDGERLGDDRSSAGGTVGRGNACAGLAVCVFPVER